MRFRGLGFQGWSCQGSGLCFRGGRVASPETLNPGFSGSFGLEVTESTLFACGEIWVCLQLPQAATELEYRGLRRLEPGFLGYKGAILSYTVYGDSI